MRIGLVADTHLPRFGHRLPEALVDGLRAAEVDLILHAGDHTAAFVVELLSEIAPVEAVAGNNDPPELVEHLGRRRIVEVGGGVRIGLVHGDLGRGRTTPERAARAFEADDVDAIVFGHSHVPLVESLVDGRLLINPGSPTDRRRQPRCSWALLESGPAGLRAHLRFFDRVRDSRL